MPYVNNNGVKIYYEMVGHGESIVFHHGNGNSLHDWYTLGYVDRLKEDFQLIMIDSRGYGKSDKPHDSMQYLLKYRADDTIAVLNELNIDQAHCLGSSIGGAWCFILARFYPERFKSYIFATPYFQLFMDDMKNALLKESQGYVEWLESRYGVFDNQKVRETFLANDTKALYAANTSEWFNCLEYTKYIDKPSLFYAGSEEPSVDLLKKLSQKIPNSKLKIIPGIGHKDAYWKSEITAPIIKEFIHNVLRFRGDNLEFRSLGDKPGVLKS